MRRGPTAVRGFGPLADWYAENRWLRPAAQVVPGRKLPQPYRRLLVHHGDMTSTLENHYHASVHVRVFTSVRQGNRYRREVVLAIDGANRPVEYGVICIHLEVLPPAARRLVLAARKPFGAILHDYGIGYSSRPESYFRIRPDARIARALRLARPRRLYGRCNAMRTEKGKPIAEIVEILPP